MPAAQWVRIPLSSQTALCERGLAACESHSLVSHPGSVPTAVS